MRDQIRNYIDELFEQAPQTRKAYELKEEMIQNLNEKYDDLVAEGKPPESAYNIAVGSIGDVAELFCDLEEDGMRPLMDPKAQKKSAMLTAIAVMLYILCPIPLFIIDQFGSGRWDVLGVILLFAMVACATGLLIYNNMTKPKFVKNDDSMVEEFREFQSRKTERRSMYGAINSAIWSIIIALYFIISFITMAWYITWVIFLIGGAISSLLRVCMAARE